MDGKIRSKIRSALRKIWLYSPERRAAKSRCRVGIGKYRCEQCDKIVKKIEIDHLTPLGATPGSRLSSSSTTWDGLINALFCPASGMRGLCNACHSEVTLKQRKALNEKARERTAKKVKGSKQQTKSRSKAVEEGTE